MGWRKLKLQSHRESLCERPEGGSFGCILSDTRAHNTWRDQATAAIGCNRMQLIALQGRQPQHQNWLILSYLLYLIKGFF